MSEADRRLERVCQAVAVLASAGFAWAAFWELGDSFSAGHFAAASAVCTAAENMWRWGILGPVTHALAQAPSPSEFYCHHPWGIFWVSAPFMKLLGHHAWACRLPAALQSVLTIPALYFSGRALWGPVAGAVAAVSFAVVPIALSFSGYNALEVPAIFGTLLAIWGYARFRQGYRARAAWLALAGLLYGICADWPVVVFSACMLGAIFVSVFLLRRWTVPADRRRIATFWALGAALCTLAVGAHLYAFAQLGQLSELFAQGGRRAAGSHLPLAAVLAARKFWIEVSFTSLAIALGKIALPVLSLRVLLKRTELEALPLAVLAMALFQYLVFKQGADVHIFWPHYFALYFALACAGMAQSALDLIGLLAQKWTRFSGIKPSYGVLAASLALPLMILPDGLRALHYAHRSGGRFNENGRPIKPDKDKVAALDWLTQRWPGNTGVTLHPGMRQSLWVDWSLQRPVTTVTHLPSGPGKPRDRYYVADLRFMSAAEQDTLAANFSLTALGPFLAVDRAAATGDLHAFNIERVEPSTLEAYWVSSSHALRRVNPDPFLTWELKDRFDLNPNPPPNRAPKTFEELRIAHNIAVSRGDATGAAHWLAELLAGCDQSPARSFGSGEAHTLLGTRLERGSSLVFSVYVRAAGADPLTPELIMHSLVTEAPPGSLVNRDATVADVGMPFAIPSNRWKSGYVYSSVTEVIRRIGKERWTGKFRTHDAIGSRLSPEFELLRLE